MKILTSNGFKGAEMKTWFTTIAMAAFLILSSGSVSAMERGDLELDFDSSLRSDTGFSPISIDRYQSPFSGSSCSSRLCNSERNGGNASFHLRSSRRSF